MDNKRIIVPLDTPRLADALALAARLDPKLCRVKIGKELFVAAGPEAVSRVHERGFEVFLDLKFHDIPHTVAGACRSAARLGVWMMNVHAAVDSVARPPMLIAVTVLTSLTGPELEHVGLAGSVMENVERLARLARACGLDGVVCSAQEAAQVRQATGADFTLVTPGIRLAADAPDDQARVVTPREAVRLGADYLVIGRPITGSPDPAATLQSIRDSLDEALA